MKKIGILGGTFNPIHEGHLNIARCARDFLSLDEVWFLPAGTPPHKDVAEHVSAWHRKNMVNAAIASERAFLLCDIELEKKNLELNSKLEYPERENKLLQKNYQQLEETYKQLKEDNKSINAMFETINNELKQQQKDTRTARSDYKHIVETLNKLQKEYNNLQNENKEYRVIFAEIKKMSLKERIFGEYPDDIKELTSGK